jgi:hypothetical protein
MPDLLRAGADEALACCWGMEINPLPREAVLIVNVHSRKGEALFAQAKEKLEQGGVRLIAAHAVHDPDRLQDMVRQAVASGAPMVRNGR